MPSLDHTGHVSTAKALPSHESGSSSHEASSVGKPETQPAFAAATSHLDTSTSIPEDPAAAQAAAAAALDSPQDLAEPVDGTSTSPPALGVLGVLPDKLAQPVELQTVAEPPLTTALAHTENNLSTPRRRRDSMVPVDPSLASTAGSHPADLVCKENPDPHLSDHEDEERARNEQDADDGFGPVSPPIRDDLDLEEDGDGALARQRAVEGDGTPMMLLPHEKAKGYDDDDDGDDEDEDDAHEVDNSTPGKADVKRGAGSSSGAVTAVETPSSRDHGATNASTDVVSENGVTVGHGDDDASASQRGHQSTASAVHQGRTEPSSLPQQEQADSKPPIDDMTARPLSGLAGAAIPPALGPEPITAASSSEPTGTIVHVSIRNAPQQRMPLPSSSHHAESGVPASVERRRTGGSTHEDRERRREQRGEPPSSSATAGASSSGGANASGRSRRTLGEYSLGKTLGAGSMGKVKLGVSSVSGEKVAIKIIPRYTSTAAAHRPPPPPVTPAANGSAAAGTAAHDEGATTSSGAPPAPVAKEQQQIATTKPTASFLAKAAAKDQSKEIRTMREGSLVLLLHHPYVCGMKSMVLYPNHYYMVFEYVNGGQMLDYIISHGRLRERSARKFARQIGSALEYCHANSIVHRDLKIENILISKTGNIKIIDFGLSNLYSPDSHLSTFCGSLYFAAPELLNAKPYIGPEVDVWSFGIVLYVLVCGKVPFDDQSMPALHAKIKRGQVEYPTWLSAECKHLLSRMLVTNPATRATLQEVLSHPWILKGFSGPPTSHLPARTPLRPEEIDREVVKGMTGFELGSDEEIFDNLVDVLVTDAYRTAVKNWEARRAAGAAAAVAGSGLPEGESGTGADYASAMLSEKERPATRIDGKDMKGLGRSPTGSKRFSGIGFYGKKIAGGLNAAFASGGGQSHAKGFGSAGHGGVRGNGGAMDGDLGDYSSSSSGSLGSSNREPPDPTRGYHPLISLYYLVKEKIEREKIYGPGVFASSTLSLTGPPPPPAPAMAYQAGSNAPPAVPVGKPSLSAAVVEPSQPPMASPHMPLTPQPRQRATADDFGRSSGSPHHGGALASRTDDYRFNKRSSFLPSSGGAGSGMTHSASTPTSPSMHSAFARTSQQAGYEPPTTPSPATRTQQPIDPDDVPLSSSPSGFARRFGSLLGRSSPSNDSGSLGTGSPGGGTSPSSYKGHRQRASIATSSHRVSTKTAVAALPQVNETSIRASGSDVPLPSPPEGKAVTRSSTVGEMSPNRHHRGMSMGASPSSRTDGPITAGANRTRQAGDEPGMFDEVQEELADPVDNRTRRSGSQHVEPPSTSHEHQSQQPRDVGFVGRTAAGDSEQAKPVWLKGLFSVTTTTTKSTATIRADLVRVLDRLGVQHCDVKSGFECAHVPSIDLSSVGAGTQKKERGGTIRRRASKLLLSREKGDNGATDAEASSTSLNGGTHATGRHASSTSFEPDATAAGHTSSSPTATTGPKFGSSTNEGSTVSSDMIVRFEIFIVKMPLLPGINGLQFRRIGGNAWQYQMLAKRVLSELKL